MLLSNLSVNAHPALGLAFPGSDTSIYHYISEGGMGSARLAASWKYSGAGVAQRSGALNALGINPLLTFECNDEARTKTSSHGVVNQIPLDMNEWLTFVRDVVAATDAAYQVVNEWNSPDNPNGGWKGTDQELIDFVVQTANEIRAGGGTVYMGGITDFGLDAIVLNRGLASYSVCTAPGSCLPPSFFQTQAVTEQIAAKIAVLQGVAQAVDGLDLHLYGPPDRTALRVQAIRGEGWSKPLFSAECGGPSLNYENYSDEAHFMAVCELMLDIVSEGMWGQWFLLGEIPGSNSANARVALSANGVPKPGYWAMKLLAHALEGATSVTKNGTVYTVSHPQGGRVIAWGAGYLVVPPGKLWRVTDPVTGEYTVRTLWKSKSVPLTQWPLVAGL